MNTSLSFAGTISSNLVIPYTSDLDFGTGDFTIEWYQYKTDTNSYPRPFSRGTYSNANIAVSFEGDTFYLWHNSFIASVSIPNLTNTWIHFAIARSSGTTQVFINGVSQASLTDTTDYTSSDNLTIANESAQSSDAAFGGYMFYFSWNKGFARYTENFTVSNTYTPILESTILLLKTNGFAGTLGNTVITSNVGTVAEWPYINPPPPPPPSQPFYRMVGSLYSDNTKVYKPHSLSASIGSTVRNSRAVARRT